MMTYAITLIIGMIIGYVLCIINRNNKIPGENEFIIRRNFYHSQDKAETYNRLMSIFDSYAKQFKILDIYSGEYIFTIKYKSLTGEYLSINPDATSHKVLTYTPKGMNQ